MQRKCTSVLGLNDYLLISQEDDKKTNECTECPENV